MNYRLKKIDVYLLVTILVMAYVNGILSAGRSLNMNFYFNLPINLIIIWRISIELNFISYAKIRVENEKEILSQSIGFILRKVIPFTIFTLIITGVLTIVVEGIGSLILNIFHYGFLITYFIALMAILGNHFKEERTLYTTTGIMVFMFILTYLNIGSMGIHEYLPTTFPKDMNVIPKVIIVYITLYATYYGLRKWKYEV